MILNLEQLRYNTFSHEEILNIVSRHFGMDAKALKENPKKRGDIALARKYSCYFIKKYCKKKKLKEIGEIVGYRNKERHATVLYHLRDMDNRIPIYKDLQIEVGLLEKSIEKKFEFLLELEGYTIKDAIDNPDLLDLYKKQEGVNGNHTNRKTPPLLNQE